VVPFIRVFVGGVPPPPRVGRHHPKMA
jgi:hypothetical protein